MAPHRSPRSGRVLAALLLGFACLTARSQAPAWPQKPVHIIVAYAPGGVADIMARVVGQVMTENTGQTFVIENKGGANGNLAADYIAKSAPDGYTLCLCSTVIESVNPFLFSKVPFDPDKDVVPIAPTGRIQVFLVTKPGLNVAGVKEFVQAARNSKAPLTFGSAGAGSTPHLVGELFKRSAQFPATHVPYRGAMPAIQDLLAGQFDFFFDPGLSFPFVRDGKLKMLAVASGKRSDLFPNVPTLAEMGYPGLDYDTWFGLYGPGKLPPALVKRINEEVGKAMANESLRKRYREISAEAVPLSSAEFKAVALREKEAYSRVIKDNGIRAD